MTLADVERALTSSGLRRGSAEEKLESDARISRGWGGGSDHHQDGVHFPHQGSPAESP